MTTLNWIAFILVVIGGLNWGLVGLFGLDLVRALFGANILSNIIYVLVGLSAVWILFTVPKMMGSKPAMPQ